MAMLTCLCPAWVWPGKHRWRADGLTSWCWSSWCIWPLWCHPPACSWTRSGPVNTNKDVQPRCAQQDTALNCRDQFKLYLEELRSAYFGFCGYLQSRLDGFSIFSYCVWRCSLFRSSVVDITADVKLVCGEEVYWCLLETFKYWTWRGEQHIHRLRINPTTYFNENYSGESSHRHLTLTTQTYHHSFPCRAGRAQAGGPCRRWLCGSWWSPRQFGLYSAES